MHEPKHKNKPPLSTRKQDKQRIKLCCCTTTAKKLVSIFSWRDGHHPRKDKSNIFVSNYAWTNVTKASIHTTVVWLNELRNNTHKHSKRNNHHVVHIKRSSLLHYDSKLWSINFVLNNIRIKSTTVFERYKMVRTCTFNYVTMSIPNPKRNKCARPQLRTLTK